jgi:crotonobetainyl-CoA:carnitine CoA-transferase CaiB-like acyl-CoA transferase
MLDSDRYWTAFCTAMDFPELEHDARFATFFARAEHRDELCSIISHRIGSMPLVEAHRRLVEHRCAFSSFATLDEVLADPQVAANGYLLDHPGGEDRFVVAPPLQFDEQPATVRSAAPEVGQHTEEVLLELDYTWEQILELKDADVTI